MRVVGEDMVYRAEMNTVFQEIHEEGRAAIEAVTDEEFAADEDAHQNAHFALTQWRTRQLVHALVRISSVTSKLVATSSGALKMTPVDVLKMVDDALREEDEELDPA